MLTRIEIQNFALISHLNLDLGNGVNVFSGETGAGKSILLDALSFLLGARSNLSWIRNGSQRMSITGSFVFSLGERLKSIFMEQQLMDCLDEAIIINDQGEAEAEVVFWRELQINGRSQARVNGLPVNANVLKTIGSELLEMQGQQDILYLLQAKQHLAMLDHFGSEKHSLALANYHKAFITWQEQFNVRKKLAAELAKTKHNERSWHEQLEEISKANLVIGEEEIKEKRLEVLQSLNRIQEYAKSALDTLDREDDRTSSAMVLLYQAKDDLEALMRFDPTTQELSEQVASIYWQLEEAVHDLRAYLNNLDADPYEEEKIVNRLATINALQRKYGSSIKGILEYQQEITEKLKQLKHNDYLVLQAEIKLAEAEETLKSRGSDLSHARYETAKRLERAIILHLDDLLMVNCRFEVSFHNYADGEYHHDGCESCEFLIAPNPGEPPKPLTRIASGGELVRILLALKQVMYSIDAPQIMIFDEPDSGLSGAAVRAMALALAKLGLKCQLILVTHQAAVASIANQHYLISKSVLNDQTFTAVDLLNRDGRIEEILRLLAADNSSAPARKHAEELLDGGEALLKDLHRVAGP